MPITFECTHCNTVIEVDSRLGDSLHQCPRCRREVQVPEAYSAPGAHVDAPQPVDTLGAEKAEQGSGIKLLSTDRTDALKVLFLPANRRVMAIGFGLTLLLVLLIGLAVLAELARQAGKSGQAPDVTDTGTNGVQYDTESATEAAKSAIRTMNELKQAPSFEAAFELARRYAEDHPDEFDSALDHFRVVAKRAAGTVHEPDVHEAIRALAARKSKAIDTKIGELRAETERLVLAREVDEAIRFLQDYDGLFAAETETWRRRRAARIHSRHRHLRATTNPEQRAKGLFLDLMLKVLDEAIGKGNLAGAVQLFESDKDVPEMAPVAAEFTGVWEILRAPWQADRQILESFIADRGKQQTIHFRDGPRNVLIQAVEGSEVKVLMTVDHGLLGKTFSVEELSLSERLLRLPEDGSAERLFARGYTALQGGSDVLAWQNFEKLQGPLGEALRAWKHRRRF